MKIENQQPFPNIHRTYFTNPEACKAIVFSFTCFFITKRSTFAGYGCQVKRYASLVGR
jgi:hypothetical protein